jgi:hypothetical protein
MPAAPISRPEDAMETKDGLEKDERGDRKGVILERICHFLKTRWF